MRCRAKFALLVAASLVATGTANAYTLHRTSGGVPVRWPATPLTLYVDPSLDAITRTSEALVSRSFGAWAGVSGAVPPEVVVAAGAAGATPIASIRYEPEGYPPAGQALAITVLSYDANGTILSANLIINGAKTRRFAELVDTGPLPDSDTLFDLEEVVTHEAGHFFGLAHNNADPSVIMYFETLPDTIGKRHRTEDDEQGLRALYPDGPTIASACAFAGGTNGSAWPLATFLMCAGAIATRLASLRRPAMRLCSKGGATTAVLRR